MSIRIQNPEARYETAVSNAKISNSLEEMKKNTPEQDDALKLTISKEGMEKFRDSIKVEAKKSLGNTDVILNDYRSMISSKLSSNYGEKRLPHEIEGAYQSISDKADDLLKAYAESYDEIRRGYVDGTREAYIADSTSETGYRKLTMEEEIAELDKAYQQHVTEFERNNDTGLLKAMAEHAKKAMEMSGGRAKIASANKNNLEKRLEETEKLPKDVGKKLMDASTTFKVQYGLQQSGKIDISSLLRGINIFGTK